MKEKNKLTFTIEGKDYERLLKFEKEHDECLEKYPNMSCAQFEYSFLPDSFGELISVECLCGASILLSSDYDSSFFGSKVDIKKREVHPEDELTHKMIPLLLSMRKHLGVYLGRKSYSCFNYFKSGINYSQRNWVKAETYWFTIDEKTDKRFNKELCKGEHTDAEKCDLYFDCFVSLLKEEYPTLYKKYEEKI